VSADTILAIDIGAGTQDILIHDPSRRPENQFRLVMPSRTQIVGEEIRAVTARRNPLHLAGSVMGGGASTGAITDHLEAGLAVTATANASQTVHNRPERVAALGITTVEEAPTGSETVVLGDVDLAALESGLAAFGIPIPHRFAFAVQDHGVSTGRGNNDVRGDYLHWLVNDAKTLEGAAFVRPPDAMTRMQALIDLVPGCVIMDTGAAAVLGALQDDNVRAHANEGAVLVNIGNMHTFAALIHGRRIVGVLEHHTRGMSAELLGELVQRMQRRDLSNEAFREKYDGHGAVLAKDLDPGVGFDFVAITGPNRDVADGLGWYRAAPHGDMMLTGSFGLVDGYLAATNATSG
jgi:uncharacterized protein (DUF1786 family)